MDELGRDRGYLLVQCERLAMDDSGTRGRVSPAIALVLLCVVGAVVGGALGARFGRRLPPSVLRGVIVLVGLAGLVKFVFFP